MPQPVKWTVSPLVTPKGATIMIEWECHSVDGTQIMSTDVGVVFRNG